MGASRDFTREEVIKAIEGSFGIMSKVAKNLGGCAWDTARKYVNKWESTKQAYENEDNRSLDLSESKMLELINEKDGPMIRFHLATKGKGRGYVQKSETDITSKGERVGAGLSAEQLRDEIATLLDAAKVGETTRSSD